MKRIIASFLFVLALTSATIAQPGPTLPWTTFSGMAKYAVGAQPTACGFMAVVVIDAKTAYALFVNEEGTRIVMWFDPNYDNPSAAPTHVASASVDPTNHDLIPTLQWRPFIVGADEDQCPMLLARDAGA